MRIPYKMKVQQIIKLLDENLVGTKKYYDMEWYDFVAEMKRQGFQHGRGSFGDVFFKTGSPFVYKIYERDAAYNAFVDYCLANPSNKHLPKIYNRRKIHQIHKRNAHVGDFFWAVKIEHLIPIEQDSKMDQLFSRPTFKSLFNMWSDAVHKNELHLGINFNYVAGNLDELYGGQHTWEETFDILERDYGIRDCEQVFSTLFDLYYNNPNFTPDMHAGNFMLRQDGTFVITDPWFDRSELLTSDIFRQPTYSPETTKTGPRKIK